MEAWFFLTWLALFLPGCPARAPTYPQPQVEVQCGPNHMVVTVPRDLFGRGKLVEPTELALGSEACPPWRLEAQVVVFQASLHGCGSVVQMTPEFLIYQTQLFYKPSLANHPVIVRNQAATIRLECRYPRKDNVSSGGLRPTWLPLKSTALMKAKLGFSLSLMNEDWTGRRASNRVQLGEPLRLQADVQAENWLPPLRLWVESCRASTSPGPTSGPRHDIVGASGCLLDGREEGVSSAFLAPRLRPETLRFTVDAFRFAREAQERIYITCRLKVTPGDQPPDVLNKACSFDGASRSWLPVEGPSTLCGCCETRSCGGAMEGQDPQGSDNEETAWQRSLTVEAGAPEVAVDLGPFVIVDPERGTTGRVPEEAVEEEIVMEELIPARPKVTHPPLREQVGSSRASVDRKDHSGLPLEAFVQQGPLFFGGAQEGSGFGDPTEEVAGGGPPSAPARPSKPQFSGTERVALGIKAEGLPRTLEVAAAYTDATLPKQVVNMATKDGKQPRGKVPGWPLLLLLLPPMGALVVALLSLVAWRLLRRRRRSHPKASPVSLELQCQ